LPGLAVGAYIASLNPVLHEADLRGEKEGREEKRWEGLEGRKKEGN